MVTADFREFALEQLRRATAAAITHRAMFGGVGVYADGVFFALMADDVLYLKVDDRTRGTFEARGMGPFLPHGDAGRPMRGYRQLPGEVLEEPSELESWVAEAIAVARRAKK